MKVSAVVCVWNGARFLGAALDSIRAQERPADEIVVIDDGSTDETPRIAQAADVRYLRIEHAGVSAARNRGLDEATGDLIAFLDCDDRWTPDKLRVQVGFMLENPSVGFTCPHAHVELEVPRPHWLAPVELERDGPNYGTSSLVAWRWAFDKVGRFDETLRLSEDTDWIARAADARVPMAVVPHTLHLRRVHDQNLSYERRKPELLGVLRAKIARGRAPS